MQENNRPAIRLAEDAVCDACGRQTPIPSGNGPQDRSQLAPVEDGEEPKPTKPVGRAKQPGAVSGS